MPPLTSDASPLTPSRRRPRAGALILALALLPAGAMIYAVLTGTLAAEPIKDLTHRTGTAGITLLTITLAVTPIRRLTGWNGVQSYRRMLGLVAFGYIAAHVLVYLVLDQFFDWGGIADDIGKRPYITVGFAGFLILAVLALTSTRSSVRRLGRNWARLHALLYVAALAGVIHFTWSQKRDVLRPQLYGATLAVLLAARLVPRLPARRPRE